MASDNYCRLTMAITVGRDEHWIGLGLDRIRAVANFVELGLDLWRPEDGATSK